MLSKLACGAFGGLLAALATHPLDTIKTRMQSGRTPTTVAACIRSTFRVDGVGGFYRGITVPVMSQPLYVGSSFAGLQAGYYLWDRHEFGAKTKLDGTSEAALRLAFGGAIGGAACAVAVTPGERLKVVLQMQGSQGGAAMQSPLQTARALVASGGYKNLFVGLRATVVREVPGTIKWFAAFETVTSRAESQGLSRPVAVLCGAVAVRAAVAAASPSPAATRVCICSISDDPCSLSLCQAECALSARPSRMAFRSRAGGARLLVADHPTRHNQDPPADRTQRRHQRRHVYRTADHANTWHDGLLRGHGANPHARRLAGHIPVQQGGQVAERAEVIPRPRFQRQQRAAHGSASQPWGHPAMKLVLLPR